MRPVTAVFAVALTLAISGSPTLAATKPTTTLPAVPLKSPKYPQACKDVRGDGPPGLDLVSADVRQQGQGLLFTWRTAAPIPAVEPGDAVALRAYMATGEFATAGIENVAGSGVEIFSILNSANKPSGSITLSDEKGKQRDVTADVTLKQSGTEITLFVPLERLWMLSGAANMRFRDDIWRYINAGKWTFSGVRDNEAWDGRDDHCGKRDEQG